MKHLAVAFLLTVVVTGCASLGNGSPCDFALAVLARAEAAVADLCPGELCEMAKKARNLAQQGACELYRLGVCEEAAAGCDRMPGAFAEEGPTERADRLLRQIGR